MWTVKVQILQGIFRGHIAGCFRLRNTGGCRRLFPVSGKLRVDYSQDPVEANRGVSCTIPLHASWQFYGYNHPKDQCCGAACNVLQVNPSMWPMFSSTFFQTDWSPRKFQWYDVPWSFFKHQFAILVTRKTSKCHKMWQVYHKLNVGKKDVWCTCHLLPFFPQCHGPRLVEMRPESSCPRWARSCCSWTVAMKPCPTWSGSLPRRAADGHFWHSHFWPKNEHRDRCKQKFDVWCLEKHVSSVGLAD